MRYLSSPVILIIATVIEFEDCTLLLYKLNVLLMFLLVALQGWMDNERVFFPELLWKLYVLII